MRPRWRRTLAAGALAALFGCVTEEGGGVPRYVHNRADYEAFRAPHAGILDPNYLPFMAWRVEVAGADEDWLVFCRWPAEAFPLAVHVGQPEIGAALQDEFHPQAPGAFVAAARRAVRTWEQELEGLVSFHFVARPEDAVLRLRLLGEPAPVPDGRKVLGTTPLGEGCRVDYGSPPWASFARTRAWLRARFGRPARADTLPVRFARPELRVFIADEFGLLNPDQVERIALHEVGHALGMRRHSPVPNDLMFETVRERPRVASLTPEDVNSFVSLYALPQGTVYRRLPPDRWRPPVAALPEGSPKLDLAPHVDARRGFEIQLPAGWMKVDTPTGVAAIDGVTWDYDASLQLIVRRFPDVDTYLARHAASHVGEGRVVEQGPLRVADQPAFRLVVLSADGSRLDEHTFIEAADGRVFVAIGDCAPRDCAAYRPWFGASLASLEIWQAGGAGVDRQYGPAPSLAPGSALP